MSQPVNFHAVNPAELGFLQKQSINPRAVEYDCGACGKPAVARLVCSLSRNADNAEICWCLCPCPKEEPTVIVRKGVNVMMQLPEVREFHATIVWPDDVRQLYEEAAKTFAAGAYTATAMLARKLLMVCACHEGEDDGKSFVAYVEFITNQVLTFPKAKPAINAIRSIGNDANHEVQFVSRDDAHRAMKIVTYLLNTIYSFPSA